MSDFNKYSHVGKLLAAFNMNSVCSPLIKMILNPEVNPEELAFVLTQELQAIFRDRGGLIKMEWGLRPPQITVHPMTRIIQPEEIERETLRIAVGELRQIMDTNRDKQLKAMEEVQPSPGYWIVEGIRHSALVKASTPFEAISKATNEVGSWESPTARFLGTELPDVLPI